MSEVKVKAEGGDGRSKDKRELKARRRVSVSTRVPIVPGLRNSKGNVMV
jgi:hypothetical protein